MKKSVLILGIFISSWLNAGTSVKDSIAYENMPVKIERSAFKTEMLKAKWVRIQLKNTNNQTVERKIKLLKELKPIISKIERDLREI